MWLVNPKSLLTVFGMAIVTYGLRASGLLLAEKLPEDGPWLKILNCIPGTVLIAIVSPEIMAMGWLGLFAASVTVLVMIKIKNVFIAMTLGIVSVAIARHCCSLI